jgi:pyruvate-formate lyase-activating enzyme
LTAALAGVPMGIQRQGVWAGRRQLFVRFAEAAETATMYSADALARELIRGLERTTFHSVCIAGRDALANEEYLAAAFRQVPSKVPVMVDTDGQRPGAIAALHSFLQLVQVTIDAPASGANLERVWDTVKAAARLGCAHAVVVVGGDDTSDADYLQIVEGAREASAETAVVLHPGPAVEKGMLDRRWSVLLEHAMARHPDVRVAYRLSGPATVR